MGDRTVDNKDSTYVKSLRVSGEQIYPHKRLIVCCDGTWNGGDPEGRSLTNVAKIARCVGDVDDWKGRPGTSKRTYIQIVHYQPGIGLGTSRHANLWDALTARGLSKAIRAAYSFICLNWSTKEDKIVLIGFSRGAFTIRCVAQFMEEVGLLTKSGLRHLPRLFKIWKNLKSGPGSEAARKLLEDRCTELSKWNELVTDVQIEACAVWDTVSAVGFPLPAHIPRLKRSTYLSVGTRIPKNVKFAVQALALNEKRRHFEPMVWDTPEVNTGQTLTQCWFAGNHGDVGGGNKDMRLADITLAWMIGQLTDKIQFNLDNLWAITTTRSWSRPSVNDDYSGTSDLGRPGYRNCRVVATARLSKDLLPPNESWTSFLQRKLGGSKPRHPDLGNVHYSVHIFHHLRMADYTNLFQGSGRKLGSLKDFLDPLSKESKFEGEILDKWTKHILCAHINLKQARNSKEQEAVEPDQPDYQTRLEGELLNEACYEAKIPVPAILSAFHRLAKGEDSTPLDSICEQMKTQIWSSKASKQTSRARGHITPTFKFDCPKASAPKLQGPPAKVPELVLGGDADRPILVLTRDFRLLMGRAHEKASTVPKPKRFLEIFSKTNGDNIIPCEKCAKIWAS